MLIFAFSDLLVQKYVWFTNTMFAIGYNFIFVILATGCEH